jgi:hypothetical protein
MVGELARNHVFGRPTGNSVSASDQQPSRHIPERDGSWDGNQFTVDPEFVEPAAHVADHRRRSLFSPPKGEVACRLRRHV